MTSTPRIISVPQAFDQDDLYVDLRTVLDVPLLLKCEGFNFAGSIKLKAAAEMVEAAQREGFLHADSVLVESSSGNLGVALSMIAASKGLRFLCVTDPRCNLATRRLIEALGSRVHVVSEPTETGGLLGARIDYVRRLCASDSRYVWLNQYTNPGNWRAHYRTTGPEIARDVPDLDVLFVGAGTTGTLMGCARFFRERPRPVRIVAVDAVGSVAFGGPPGRRMIPGLGTSVRPPILDETFVDEVIRVEEADTVRTCHRLAHRGFLFGGSTGTVVAGAAQWLAEHDADDLTAVAIAPDLGERYLDTVYQTNWLEGVYGSEVLATLLDEDGVDEDQVSEDQVDGHRVNGHRVDGHRVDGHRVDGHRVDGHRVDGHRLNGHRLNGHRVDTDLVEENRVEVYRVEGNRVAEDPVDEDPVDDGRVDEDRTVDAAPPRTT